IASERLEMMPHRNTNPLLGARDVVQLRLERREIAACVLAKNRRQELLFSLLEVEIDRAVGDAGGFRDFGDFRVEVAVCGEDVDGRAQDALALVRASKCLGTFSSG